MEIKMQTEWKIVWWNRGREFSAWTKEPQKEINAMGAQGIKAYCRELGLN